MRNKFVWWFLALALWLSERGATASGYENLSVAVLLWAASGVCVIIGIQLHLGQRSAKRPSPLPEKERAPSEATRQGLKEKVKEPLDLAQRVEKLASQKVETRGITKAQEAILTDTLRKYKRKISILFHQSALDAPSYADRLATVFDKAGWDVEYRAASVGHELKYKDGTWLVGAGPIAKTLESIFKGANINIRPSSEDVGSDLAIIIGRQLTET